MRFKKGQTWAYRTRSGDEGSKIIIMEIDEKVIHIYIDNLKLKSPAGKNIEHIYLPIAFSALEESVTELVHEKDQNFQLYFGDWSESHDTRGQGYFTMEIGQLLNSIENANPS